MNTFLLIFSLIFLLFFIINKVVKFKRFKYVNKLQITYDKMEMHFVRNNININRNYSEFLRVFKNLSNNYEYLDIQILLLSKLASEKNGNLKKDVKWFEDTLESLGEEFKDIFIEFDKNSYELIKLSIIKPDFVMFFSKMFIKYSLHSGVNVLNKMLSDLKFIQDNDEAISYSSMRVDLA